MELPRLNTKVQIIFIFVNDLPEAITSITSDDLFMFNDNTTIYHWKEHGIDSIILMLQSMLDQVYTWWQSLLLNIKAW